MINKNWKENEMEVIRSKENKKVKEARKLLMRKHRKSAYLIEGFHLLEEALAAKNHILQVFVEEGKEDKLPSGLTDLSVNFVSKEVLKSLADSENPQGVIAEVEKKENSLDLSGSRFLVLENVQDPGNVGTMIRTADAAGFDAVFVLRDTADIYSPKVLRAMQGSNFHLPVLHVSQEWLFEQIKKAGISLLTTTLSADSVTYKSVSCSRFALVMGNEGSGVSDFAISQADLLVHIDMPGQAESLNVAVAAGILMFSL